MQIRFLSFKGCPHSDAALALLRESLRELRISDDPDLIEINDMESAAANRFLGSPTIQIDGKDIEKDRQTSAPALGCRLYKTLTGTSGVPPKAMIVAALKYHLLR
jgi:glutaredoxin